MFYGVLLEFLVLPAIVLVVTFLYSFLGVLLNKRLNKSIRKQRGKVYESHELRKALESHEEASDDVKTMAFKGELGSRFKLTTLKSLRLANRVLLWVSRILGVAMAIYGFALTLGLIGASISVLYVSTVLTTECNINGTLTIQGSSNTPSEGQTFVDGFSPSDYLGQGEFSEDASKWAKSFDGFTFIGDSLGVGVESALKGYFPNSDFNSKSGRFFTSDDASLSGIKTLQGMSSIKSTLVIALGTNQPPTPELLDQMVEASKGKAKNIVFITTASEGGGGGYNKIDKDGIASTIKSYVSGKSNMAVLDWNAYVSSKLKWSDITSDSTHLNSKGNELYAKFITQGLYDLLGKKASGGLAGVASQAIQAIICGNQQTLLGDSTPVGVSSLTNDGINGTIKEEGGIQDGTGEVPADATAWGYKPSDLPASLKPYIIDPAKYGMGYGSPKGWIEGSGQCVDLTVSLGSALHGRDKSSTVVGNGNMQSTAWARIFGNSVKSKPKRGAIFSDNSYPVYGHTGIVCHVFSDGTILIVEQNTPLSGITHYGVANTWNYRLISPAEQSNVGMSFAYP